MGVVPRLFRCSMLGIVVALGGCSVADTLGSQALKVYFSRPTKIIATYEAASDMNPDDEGRASPLVVRIYELKSLSVFDNADFFSLYDDDKTVLEQDLVRSEEMEFVPGQSIEEWERELQEETRFVGILAAYRDIENAKWRASVETPSQETVEVIVRFERLGISVEVD